MTEFVRREGRLGADDRIALVGSAFAHGVIGCEAAARGTPGEVPFEIDGEAYVLSTQGGVPQRLARATAPPDWAVVLDDWDLVVPVAPVRGLTTLRGCGIRIGDTLWPLPQVWEFDRLGGELFTERIPNALLYVYFEMYGSPAGSFGAAFIYREGIPEFLSDTGDVPEKTPYVGMGISYPTYLAYRRGAGHQMAITEGSWVDANWKDLLALHGLLDMPGYARIQSGYPDLPEPLWDYMRIIAEAAKLPQAAPPQQDDQGPPPESPGGATEAAPM
ncbi:MAG: hypothetical protein V9E83_02930 [Baekduia sp.]